MLMGFNTISFRANLQEIKAIRSSCAELGINRSELIRTALIQWLHTLREEGVVSCELPFRN